MNKKAVTEAGQNYNQHPIGTGKYKFIKYITGDRLEMERFEDYHGEKAKIKYLTLRVITETSSRTIELESGAVDFVQDVAPIDMGRIADNPKLEAVAVPSNRLYYVAFDLRKAPYDDLRVRQAISYATNREGMCTAVFRGFAKPARGMQTSAIKYSKYDETPPFEFNLKKAKQLLADAGHSKGLKMKLMTSERSDYLGMCTIMQSDFKEIGIDVEIQVFEWGTFLDMIVQPEHDPFLLNWQGGAPALDPFFLMQPVFYSKARPAPNRTNYANARVDELFDKGTALPNGPERAAVYGEAWDILNHDLAWIPVLEIQTLYGQKKTLKGIQHSPGMSNYFGDAYFVK